MAAGEVELGWLCGVVARHTPAFFLHPADRYLPCSAEFFLQHSELREGAAGEGGDAGALLLPRGCVAAPLLLEAQRGLPPGRCQWLHLDPAARCGMPLVRRAAPLLLLHARLPAALPQPSCVFACLQPVFPLADPPCLALVISIISHTNPQGPPSLLSPNTHTHINTTPFPLPLSPKLPVASVPG
jgi:hypothetical protein